MPPLMTRFLAATALLLSACSAPPTTPPSAASLTVSVAKVQTRPLQGRVSASGAITAWQNISLGVDVLGLRVVEVAVELGDSVKAGQVLLRLDQRQLKLAEQQAEANVAQAQAQANLAKANANRAQELLAKKLIAHADAEQTLSNALLADAQLQSARAALAQAQLQLQFTTLRAPYAGVIAKREVEPGQVVNSGSTLFNLLRDNRVQWRAQLPEAELQQVRVGQTVELTTRSGGSVEGVIRKVAPALDAQNRTGEIIADLPKPGDLIAGMYASGEVLLAERAQRSLVDTALVERDGYRYVFVLGKNNQVSQRRVVTGQRQGEWIEILSGLEDGENVVIQGAGFLSDGDLVKVVAADATADKTSATP